MAYRRRHGVSKSSTFREEVYHKPDGDDDISINKDKLTSSYSFTSGTTSSSSSLAAQAIRASAARRDSPVSSVYTPDSVPQGSKLVFGAYDESSGAKDARGFWGVLARKAKAILDDDEMAQQAEMTARSSRFQMADVSTGDQLEQRSLGRERFKKIDNPALRKGLDKIKTSLNQIGDTFEKAYEEGRTIVENRTADIKQQIRRKGSSPEEQNQELRANNAWQQSAQPQSPMNHENQLKASRDVAMATAAKAKLLLRELKTIKADLAFAKQRCSQLEDENKLLRESREKGENAADDDLIRLQLETLLAEKARLAHENSLYARENRFLKEVVEYHKLTMQDVVFLDEGSEELAEVDPYARMHSVSPHSPTSPASPSEINASGSPPLTTLVFQVPHEEGSINDVQSCSTVSAADDEKAKSAPISEEAKAKTVPL